MAEFRIKRKDVLRFAPCKEGLDLFDLHAVQQGRGEPDVVFPDGWTETHSGMLYQTQPRFHQWLMGHGLIPRDNMASRFPPPAYQRIFKDYPDPVPDPVRTGPTWRDRASEKAVARRNVPKGVAARSSPRLASR